MDINFPELTIALFSQMPFLQKVGIKIIYVKKGEARIELPFDNSNVNHLGTLHAGVIYTFAETAGGVLITSAATSIDIIGVAKNGKISYKKPATGMIYFEDKIDTVWIADKFNEALTIGKSEIPYTVKIKNKQEDLIAEVEFLYHIRKRP